MRRALIGLTLLLSAFIWLSTGLESASTKETDTIEIAVEDEAAPWSGESGEGFANDVVRQSFAEQGIKVNFLVQPYSRCKENVLSGKVAACLSMSFSPELEGKVVFSKLPLFICKASFYFNSTKPLLAKSVSEIPAGFVIGIVPSYEYPPNVNALVNKGVILEASGTEISNLQKLALGRVDLVILNHNRIKSAASLIRKANVEKKVAKAFESGTLRSYIGFSTKHPLGAWAKENFDKGHFRAIRDGSVKKFENYWLVKWAEK